MPENAPRLTGSFCHSRTDKLRPMQQLADQAAGWYVLPRTVQRLCCVGVAGGYAYRVVGRLHAVLSRLPPQHGPKKMNRGGRAQAEQSEPTGCTDVHTVCTR